jgi:hypothetical protein
MIIGLAVGVLCRVGVRIACGCDGSPEVARVGAGSTRRLVPGVVGTGPTGVSPAPEPRLARSAGRGR